MLKRIRTSNLANFAVYGAASGLAAVLTLVLTRVLWRALTPEDFGGWSLVDPMLLPLASLVLLGIDHAIVKQLRIDGLSLPVVVGTLLTMTLPATALCLLVAGLLGGFVLHLPWIASLLLTMAGEALILMVQTALRATGAVYGFAALLLSRNLIYLVVLVAVQAHSASGVLPLEIVFSTRSACVIILSVVALIGLRPVPKVDLAGYRDALRYGLPLLVSNFMFALMDMADRWVLAGFAGVVPVGIYALHLKIAAILSQAIIIPFGLWFPPERFKRMSEHDGGHTFFVRTAVVLSVVCAYLAGCVWLTRDFLIGLLAPGVAASPFVLMCCLGAVISLALSQALNVGLLLPGHTGKNVYCTLLAVIGGFSACGILIPGLGSDGAAGARLAGGLVLLCATAAWSHSVSEVDFPFLGIAVYFACLIPLLLAVDHLTAGKELLQSLPALLAWTASSMMISGLFWRRFLQPGIRS